MITGYAVAADCINCDTSLSGEIANFGPCSIKTPEPIATKFVTIDYVGKLTAHTNRFFKGKCIKYNRKLFICTFFLNAPTGQTGHLMFMLDGSKDPESRKEVPFGGLGYLTQFRG